MSGVNPTELLNSIKKQKQIQEKLAKKASKIGIEQIESQTHQPDLLESVKIKDIILDFSCVNYIDSQGVNAIVQVGL